MLKSLEKCSNGLISNILACHLQIDADPDPAYHFDADPDPEFILCGCGWMRIEVTKMTRIRIHNTAYETIARA